MYRVIKIDKTLENSIDISYSHKIYVFMVLMSSNAEIPRSDYVDSLQLTNWILYSGVSCHMTPEISEFMLGSLVKREK